MVTRGAVLSTIKVDEGPAAAARFPALSDADPDATEILSVPSPVPDMITVGDEVSVPIKLSEPLAVPVLMSVTLAVLNVFAL